MLGKQIINADIKTHEQFPEKTSRIVMAGHPVLPFVDIRPGNKVSMN